MRNNAVKITKTLLSQEMVKLGLKPAVDGMVFRGGQDPGGWTRNTALVAVIHEGTDIPNDYNHPDPFSWWLKLGDDASKLLGKRVYFEWINSCVAAMYEA